MTRVLTAKRFDTMAAAKGKPSNGKAASRVNLEEVFGENTFSLAEMQARLPKPVYKALMRTLDQGSELEPSVADANLAARAGSSARGRCPPPPLPVLLGTTLAPEQGGDPRRSTPAHP